MYANGFFEEKRRSPVSLAAVIGLHGAAIAVLALYGTTHFVANKAPITQVFNVPIDEPPPPVPPPPPQPPTQRQLQQPDRPTVVRTDNPPVGPIAGEVTPPQPYRPPVPPGPIEIADASPVIPPPIRRPAAVDPNFRDALQPPYPAIEERAQRGGQVRVRITIGANGRVTAVEQLSATSDAFWRATQRQALSRWRFRPATVDGRPIESTMLMTVTFRIPDA
jgi:protein TonB